MVSDKYIKQAFIADALNDEAQTIKRLQQTALKAWGVKSDSGRLLRSLRQRATVGVSGSGARIRIRLATHHRLLDLPPSAGKKKRKYTSKLYNRIVYGRIYGNLIPRIRYGLTDAIKEQLAARLGQLLNANTEI